MGYKDTEGRNFFRGRYLNSDATDASAAILGSQLSASAAIVGTQLAANAAIASTQLAAGVTKVLSGTVAFGDTTKVVCTIPAKALVTDVIAVCTATWNGTSPIVDLGDDSDADGFVPNAHVGLTSGNISGEDPVNRGDLLRVAAAQTTTADDWTVTDYSAGSEVQTKTHAVYTVTAWPRALKKYYASANHVNAVVGTTGSPTTGALTVYLVYVALA